MKLLIIFIGTVIGAAIGWNYQSFKNKKGR